MISGKKRLLLSFFVIFMLIYVGLLQAEPISPRVYLPFLAGGDGAATPLPTATATGTLEPTASPDPTQTPSSTPTDTPATAEIANGDFESGRTAWTELSKWDNILIVNDDDLPRGVDPHNGRWAAWLGGDNDELATIEQTIIVDPQSPVLVYWYWIDWPFACEGDTGAVATLSLGQANLWQSDVCQDTDTGGWVQQTIDLSAYKGQSAVLRFELSTAPNSYANFYLDDVALQNAP